MKELLEYLAKSITTKPDAVEITEEKSEGGFLLLKLKVDPEDMGLVIGKGGKIIRAIRNLIRIKAIREGSRVDVELVEVPGYQRPAPEPVGETETPVVPEAGEVEKATPEKPTEPETPEAEAEPRAKETGKTAVTGEAPVKKEKESTTSNTDKEKPTRKKTKKGENKK